MAMPVGALSRLSLPKMLLMCASTVLSVTTSIRDRGVRSAPGDECEHFALATRELGKGIMAREVAGGGVRRSSQVYPLPAFVRSAGTNRGPWGLRPCRRHEMGWAKAQRPNAFWRA